MRILQVSPGYPPDPGGIEHHVQALSQALVRRGHQVTVLALSHPVTDAATGSVTAGAAQSQAADGVDLVRVPTRSIGPFALPRGLTGLLRSLAGSHQVVHVHNYHSPLPLLTLGAVRNVPVLVSPHFHGGGHSPAARLAHPAYRATFRARLPHAAGLVFVSAAERQRFERAFGTAVPASVVHHGVRSGSTARRLPFAERPPLVLSVGRLEQYKRVDLLIEALGRLPAGLPWRAVVVGAGPDLPRLQQLVERCEPAVRDRVSFTGFISDAALDRLMASARVLVSGSAHEAFGMSVLDAVAAGARVVASDIPAHRELAGLAPGRISLWDPADQAAGLGRLVETALAVDPGQPTDPLLPTLPSWDDAAAVLAERYAQVGTGHRRAGAT